MLNAGLALSRSERCSFDGQLARSSLLTPGPEQLEPLFAMALLRLRRSNPSCLGSLTAQRVAIRVV